MNTRNPARNIAAHPRSLDEVVGRNLPQWAVDFVVINLERDLTAGLHLTLKLAKGSSNPHVREMYTAATDFFKLLRGHMSQARTAVHSARTRALLMLDFPEPAELRLGYASMGSYGNGMGRGELATHLFDSLMRWPELGDLLTIEPDALCLVPKIGMDRTSDIVATIAKQQLIAFTQDQAQFWGFSPNCMKPQHVRNCWNPAVRRLDSISAEVPVDDLGRTFLLVPKEICRSGPPINPEQYFRSIDPIGPEGSGDTRKEQLLDHCSARPGSLTDFTQERMKDPQKFKPRREFRNKRP